MVDFDGYGTTIVDGAFTAGQVERDMKGQLSIIQITEAARRMNADEIQSAQKLLKEARKKAAVQSS